MRTVRWLLLASVLAVLTACAAQPSPSSPTLPTGEPTSAPPGALPSSVSVTRIGGIAGVNQTIDIAADGSWVFTDTKTSKTERGTLTPAQRTELLQLVAAPGFVQALITKATPTSGNCADAFGYQFKVGEQAFTYEDCGGAAQPAVQAVIASVTAATPL